MQSEFEAIVASCAPVVVVPRGEVNGRLLQAAQNAQARARVLADENARLRQRLAQMSTRV